MAGSTISTDMLAAFLKVAELRSVSRAAAELGVAAGASWQERPWLGVMIGLNLGD